MGMFLCSEGISILRGQNTERLVLYEVFFIDDYP